MRRITLPKDVWVSLYGKLYDTIESADSLLPRYQQRYKNDDIRDEVLNIMNFYFDRGFPVGITNETKVVIHD